MTAMTAEANATAVTEPVLAHLTDEQQKAIHDLLEAERHHTLHYWTVLNELRAQGKLTEWYRERGAGSQAQIDAFRADRTAVNQALFGRNSLNEWENFDEETLREIL
ncbi:hypothetical protein [Stutzerimonas stutzeri]|uniref:Uncharacterized protein n=1 Tax=Stutzerimonas stutzeri RCH2 TaxID=644801 RepID=L0GU84_STUST|nr:hypothetical protein [Stutzerimonas stutzeri]AGA88869.1 hypothetical protein Psest_4403 [Stutzerimonas stutzeri RCH2]